MEEKKSYEEQKQELLDIAEQKFGREYFQRLESFTKEDTEEDKPDYRLTVSCQGAFYACEE